MSLSRANTQIFKSLLSVTKKFESIEAEKAMAIEAVEKRYADREVEYKAEITQICTGLKAFGHTDESIEEFLKKNDSKLPECL